MGEAITHADLQAASEDVKGYIRERFNAVDKRLDTLNGSVARHEQAIGDIREKAAAAHVEIKNLNREVFPASYRSRRVTLTDGDDDAKPAVTKGDVKRAAAVLSILTAAILGIAKLWTVAATMMKGLK